MSKGESDLSLFQISKEELCTSSLFYFLMLVCVLLSTDRLLFAEDSVCLISLSLTDDSALYIVDF